MAARLAMNGGGRMCGVGTLHALEKYFVWKIAENQLKYLRRQLLIVTHVIYAMN